MDKGCSACHNGINIGGGMYAPFGVVEKPGAELLPPADKGRFMVTKTPSDEYVFKVPTLRNITLTAPYFHTGQAWDLRQPVAVMGASQLGIELSDDDVDKITTFLDSLTGEQPKVTYPILPPSGASTPRPEPLTTAVSSQWVNPALTLSRERNAARGEKHLVPTLPARRSDAPTANECFARTHLCQGEGATIPVTSSLWGCR
jgi:hypothetical protein